MPTAGSVTSVTNALYPGGMSYDRSPVFPSGLSRQALQRNMMLDFLNRYGKIEKGKGASEMFLDKSLTMEGAGLRKFGLYTDVIATDYADRCRMEFRMDLRYDAVEVPLLNEKIGNQQRDHNKRQIQDKELKVMRDINTLYVSGAGALATVDGQPQQEVFGLQATLDAPTSGNYGMIARSGNTFLNNTDTNLDSGGNFVSNVQTRIDTLKSACSVEIDGELMSPTLGFTSRLGLRVLKSAYLTYLKIEVGSSGVDPMKIPALGNDPESVAKMSGITFQYQNSLGESTKTLYVITPETWTVKLAFDEWIKQHSFQPQGRAYPTKVIVFYHGGQLICEHLTANGRGTWSA